MNAGTWKSGGLLGACLMWLTVPGALAAGVELQLYPETTSGTAFPNEQIVFRAEVKNPGAVEKTGKIVVTRISQGEQDRVEEREVRVAPGAVSTYEFPLQADRPRYEVLRAEVKVDGAVAASAESGFLVVDRPANYDRDDSTSFFGSMFVKDDEAARRLGIKSIRGGADWARIEPQPGQYEWTRLDAQIDEAREHKLSIVLVLRPETRPKHAAWKNLEELSRPEHIQEFEHYVEVVLQRYKDRVAAVEVINEPDLDCAHGLSEGGASTTVYARLLKAAYGKIREIAPDLPILGLGVSGVDFPNLAFSRQVLKDQPGFLDIISGHPYSYARYVGGSFRPQSPLDLNTKARIQAMADLMKDHGLTPRLWITEFGWALDRRETAGSPAAFLHAAYSAQAITLARAVPALERLYWFAMMFPGLENGTSYGMYRGDAAKDKTFFPLPAAAAFATCARWLDHARSVGEFSVAEILHVERFARGEDAVFVLWMRDAENAGGSARMMYPKDGPEAKAVTAMGVPVSLSATAPVAVTSMPIFLEVPLDQGDAMEAALKASQVQAAKPVVIQTVLLTGATTARVNIVNNRGRDISVKIFETGDADHAQSRRLKPGLNSVSFAVPPRKEKAGFLPVTVLDEMTGETLEGRSPYHLEKLAPLRGVTLAKMENALAAAPKIVLDQRDQVLPADPGVDWKGADDLSATVQTGWSPEGWAVVVKVRDDIHAGPSGSESPWASDSLQIVFDADQRGENGLGEGCREFALALTPGGTVVVESYPSGKVLDDLPADVTREGGQTTYKLLVPWSKLGRNAPPEGEVMRMNLIVNDNDGKKRKCWIGITPGIGESKTPGIYRQWLIGR